MSFFKFFKPYLFFLTISLVLPLLLGAVVYSIFQASLPRELPIGLIDKDQSTLSLEVGFDLEATSVLHISKRYQNLQQAKDDLSVGNIYGLVLIPEGFERNVRLGRGSEIPLYYNAQFVLIGKAINGAFSQVIAALNAKVGVLRGLVESKVFAASLPQALPIKLNFHALYNPNNNYAQFLLTLILPCIWQILTALGMLNLLDKPSKFKSNSQALGVNVAIFACWGVVMLWFFQGLGYPMEGSYSILFLGVLVLAASISGIVLCIQAVLKDSAKSIGVIAAYTAPSLAFAGITYPQNAMDSFALFWSHILPISYFMELYLQQANYGLDIAESLKTLAQMLPFLLFCPLGLLIGTVRVGDGIF
ncbi:hypothetical protein BKH46_05315 [Helicobacter sp. 12S02634-8]|nr:hypothetical protein BKH46_05315 [Helicobacter sp. 12S02634-8]